MAEPGARGHLQAAMRGMDNPGTSGTSGAKQSLLHEVAVMNRQNSGCKALWLPPATWRHFVDAGKAAQWKEAWGAGEAGNEGVASGAWGAGRPCLLKGVFSQARESEEAVRADSIPWQTP